MSTTGALLRTPIETSPFLVGRRPGLGLTLTSSKVSEVHAEIYRAGEELRIRDLSSTNGTFLNRNPLSTPALLRDGDVVHFADLEFRLVREDEPQTWTPVSTHRLEAVDLPRRFSGFRVELLELIDKQAVRARFEPIVRLADLKTLGWEALAVGTAVELPAEPVPLFALATETGLAAELSRLCRARAVEAARDRLAAGRLFLNADAAELAEPERLVSSLADLSAAAGGRQLVLEVHETAASDLDAVRELGRALTELGVELAYDDFGSGRARLLELAEAPPDYLKFDRQLVSGLDAASPSRLRVIEALTTVARDLGITTIAEGVETAGELEACRAVGFDAAQGYHFCRPPAELRHASQLA